MELYSYVPPLGTKIPISVQPFAVDDLVPTEEEIEWAVMRLRNHRSGGPSGMRAEHLKRWIAKARKAEKEKEKDEKEEATTMKRAGRTENGEISAAQTETEADNWTRFVDLVQLVFREGTPSEESMWQAVVLIPKGKKDYQGHCPRGGDVEGSGSNFKSPDHSLHHLLRLPPWVPGMSRDRYRHPQGQAASAAHRPEGGGPVRDLHGPAQDV